MEIKLVLFFLSIKTFHIISSGMTQPSRILLRGRAVLSAVLCKSYDNLAMVDGYAIGGGHVLHVLCDLTIASDRAIFGQIGPKFGSFDAGFGAIYLARIVGEKKAREIWYLCKRYTAQDALDMGLVNKVVSQGNLESEVMEWAGELLQRGPTALRFLKHAFNADTDHVYGIQNLAHGATAFYYATEEGREGTNAFLEKRSPDFSKYRRMPW